MKKKACILSLDFYKAYDRVLIDYLLKVMQKMNFSDNFCSWIRMLHEEAKTCFILHQLTELIPVNFSIRQGDPLSMILYIIYTEPLLLCLDRHLSGIHLLSIPPAVAPATMSCALLSVPESVEAFCVLRHFVIFKIS